MEDKTETSSDSGDEESAKLTPYTDICSGVKGKGSSKSDGMRDMDNNNGDVREEESDDPLGIYNLLNQEDKNKEGEPLVSDDFSKPSGFAKIIAKENIVSGKEDRQGRCPRIASSLPEKMNEFVEIGQAMGFSMEECVNDIEKLISRKGGGMCYQ
nr:RNA-directed DNA polymerase, eukaryota [Tanacetum cinerariifolium]GEY96137.1 RNA-directed DNA polymerase, eukaryota [Tanacetum cinerariifolium]